MTTTYKIKLPQFEGPFDLLLFFIERDELDIYDIPISKLTDDFLEYLRQMEDMNLEIASEFILMASTLMQVKVKMLLPRPELNEQGEEIDPREELVRRLIEYKKYKSVVKELSQMEDERALLQARGFIQEEMKKFQSEVSPGEALQPLDLYALLKAFHNVLLRHQEELRKPKHVIYQYNYTIPEQKEFILGKLNEQEQMDFISLLELNSPEEKSIDKFYIIFNFLAILELIQEKKVSLTVGRGYNNFWLKKRTP